MDAGTLPCGVVCSAGTHTAADRSDVAAKAFAHFKCTDHDLLQDGRILGRAVQDWVLVDTATRKLAGMKNIPILWELPCPQPQRTESIRRLRMPDVLPCEAQTIIATEEIDDNGHLNNVAYIRHAQRFAAPDCTGLEVSFDRECFAGEALTLHAGDGFVRGDKADGSESFRLHFYRAEEK